MTPTLADLATTLQTLFTADATDAGKAGRRLTRRGEIGIAFAFLAREPLDYRHVAQWLEHHLDTVGVGGSIPPVPTTAASAYTPGSEIDMHRPT